MSETITIKKKTLIAEYNKATQPQKILLEKLHGAAIFQKDIMQLVKSYEDACKILKLDPIKELPYKKPTNATQKALNAVAKLFIIARALNQSWVPNWKDSDQVKYWPWFEANKSGAGLSFRICVDWRSLTDVGSLLCYRSKELAEYAGKQFIKEYNDFMSI